MAAAKAGSSLALHYRRYAIGNVLTLVAGLITFPITTRLLTNEQFGLLGYWEAWIVLLVAVFKLGAGDTIMRFYPSRDDPQLLVRHATNFVLVPTLLGLAGWGTCLVVASLGAVLGLVETPWVMLVALGIVLVNVLTSHVLWVMRTRQLSGLGTVIDVSARWLGVGATLITLFYVSQSVIGMLVARMAAGAIILALLISWTFRNLRFSWAAVDMPYAREGLAYGIPLALKELSGVVLAFVDRIMLRWLLGDLGALGIYVIGSSLATYVDQLVTSALGQAWTPAVNRVYNTEGADAVRALKARVLRPLVYVCAGLAIGIVVGGQDLVVLVAGAGKAAAAPIFVLSSVLLLVTPVLTIGGTGLLLERKSKTYFALTLVAAGINIVANLALIPVFGIFGAAISTSCSQIVLYSLFYGFCPPALRCLPRPKVIFTAGVGVVAFLALHLVVEQMSLVQPWARLLILIPTMLLGYVVPVLAMDPEMRAMALALRRRREGA